MTDQNTPADGAISGSLRAVIRLLAVVEWLIGAALLAGGAWLLALGGSLYYALAGIGYVAAAVLFWRLRPAGAWLTAGVFLLSVVWALWECGPDFWPLFARLFMPAGMATVALLLAPSLLPSSRPVKHRRGAYAGACALALSMVVGFGMAFGQHGVISPAPDAPYALAAAADRPSDWTHYGRTAAGTRYAPFGQINRSNVSRLRVAWTYRRGDRGPETGVDQNTPLQIGDTLYTCSTNNNVAALDADTGQERWRYTVNASSPMWQRCRGLGYYEVNAGDLAASDLAAGQPCRRRVFTNTIDARLIALDANTGALCPGFGTGGQVDLKVNMGPMLPGENFQTSAPLVARDYIVIGGWVVDNQGTHETSGVIRAFDARTGALVWAWDMGNPETTLEPPPGQPYTPGTPNAWSTLSYDDALGLVYLPTGNETPDFYGIGRSALGERFNSSIVALDVLTGRLRWHVQTVHHDIWDYDVPSQPALVDIPGGPDGPVRALLQTTKRGQLFLLDRATGSPLAPIEERPVPQTGQVPEERLSPTQPYSTGMPPIGAERLTEARMWGITPLDQLWCRIAYKQMRDQGEFTPPGLQWAIDNPGNIGGLNWGSVSYDPVNGYAFMNDIRIPNKFLLAPPEEWKELAKRHKATPDGHGPSPQRGTPYGIVILQFLSPLGVPCVQPPYGTVSAVDLKTRKIAWQIPAGTVEELGPLGIKTHLRMPVGLPTYAGTSTTAGGLVFWAGAQDFYLRAYDASNGREIWRHPLPVGSSATPMTYISPKTGRQYVVVSVGGAAYSKLKGDYVMAFTLPSPDR